MKYLSLFVAIFCTVGCVVSLGRGQYGYATIDAVLAIVNFYFYGRS